MAFLFGSVSFSRFKIVGGAPKRLDDALLDKLRHHAIGAQRSVRPDHEEIGWLGGRHLLDRDFALEKNILVECLHFALRIDVSRIPPELLRAYVEQELESLRAEGGARRDFARLKKQAVEAARRRADREIKDGHYRRSRQFPILLDGPRDVLYLAAGPPAVSERLHPLFRETFGKRLEPITAGQVAYEFAERHGLTRRIESLQPSKLVAPPDGDGRPDVWWTAHDPASRDYLGNEFLLWLWFTLGEDSDTVALPDDTEAAVVLVKNLTLECPWGENGKETISAEGPTQLPEARRAIQSGKLPRKAGLIVSRQDQQYTFTLQAETLNVSSAVLPKVETNGDPRACFEERVQQIRHLAETLDLLYGAFLKLRLSTDWPALSDRLRAWLRRS